MEKEPDYRAVNFEGLANIQARPFCALASCWTPMCIIVDQHFKWETLYKNTSTLRYETLLLATVMWAK